MQFNSFSFILLFMPLCLGLYYIAGRAHMRAATGILVGASLLFYSWWNPVYLVLLLGSIAFNYGCGLVIRYDAGRAALQRWALRFGVIGNLSLLFYYKYLFSLLHFLNMQGFALDSAKTSVILPLGISFFTFTQIGYLIDSKAGVARSNNLLDYILFVTFFPHLISGPILHHREMMPQFADPKTYRFRGINLAVGLTAFILGLAKKVLFADHLAPLVTTAFEHPAALGVAGAWGGAIAFWLQIYFDFSGYSEMAIGLALMFGVRFPANFNSPYKATSIIQFWQHWHMTLTRYLTLYLYHPMVLWVLRHRKARGKAVSKRATATVGGFLTLILLPAFYTMGIAGIWHGAGLQFLVFGLLHATYLSINHAWRIWGLKQKALSGLHPAAQYLSRAWKIGLTALAVVVSSVFFRARSVDDAWAMLRSMAGKPATPPVPMDPNAMDFVESSLKLLDLDLAPWLARLQFSAPLTLLFGIAIVWWTPNVLQLLGAYSPSLSLIPPTRIHWRPTVLWGLLTGLIAVVCLMALNGTSEFLYFQF